MPFPAVGGPLAAGDGVARRQGAAEDTTSAGSRRVLPEPVVYGWVTGHRHGAVLGWGRRDRAKGVPGYLQAAGLPRYRTGNRFAVLLQEADVLRMGTIPAGAGSRPRLLLAGRRCRDHPRRCREYDSWGGACR